MKIFTIQTNSWVEPELLAKLFKKKYGIKGFAWLDSDKSENGEWSILGVNPKDVISCKKENNISNEDNPFKKLKKIQNGFWMGWLSYEAGAWLEPKNQWQESEVATLWIASFDPIIRINLIDQEIFIEGSKLKEINIYKNLIENINKEN